LPSALASVCQQDNCHTTGQDCLGLSQYSLNRPQPDGAAGVRHYSPSDGNGSAPIHNAHPHDAKTIPHDGCVQAQIQTFLAPRAQGLSNHGVMSSNDINASIRQPSAKPSLMGLCDLSAAFHIQAKPALDARSGARIMPIIIQQSVCK
jgi:hypothetical protein